MPSSCSASTALSPPPGLELSDGMEGTPTVTLDTDEVTQEMAARLTIALLGQILYMKGQVPFPIASLSRMVVREDTENASRMAIRAKKQRIEFLQSYDDLTSHLRTTFVALSTALAKNENNYPIYSSLTYTPPSVQEQNLRSTGPKTRRHPAKVYILFILGPSPSAAKARYLLEIDGFRVEQFGEGHDSCYDRDHDEPEDCSSEREGDSAESSKFISHTHMPARPPISQRSSSENNERGSPCSSLSRGTSYSVSVPSSPSVNSISDDGGSSECSARHSEELNPFILEHRVEEASLRTGERSLYRTLFAGDERLGFGDEISPTQVHVFIRAPRRFTHPTWIPRQSLGSMLDLQVQCFLESESGFNSKKATRPRKQTGFGVGLRTVGIRVKCQDKEEGGTVVKRLDKIDSSNDGLEDHEDEEYERREDDELIWWSWDGKLVGFRD